MRGRLANRIIYTTRALLYSYIIMAKIKGIFRLFFLLAPISLVGLASTGCNALKPKTKTWPYPIEVRLADDLKAYSVRVDLFGVEDDGKEWEKKDVNEYWQKNQPPEMSATLRFSESTTNLQTLLPQQKPFNVWREKRCPSLVIIKDIPTTAPGGLGEDTRRLVIKFRKSSWFPKTPGEKGKKLIIIIAMQSIDVRNNKRKE